MSLQARVLVVGIILVLGVILAMWFRSGGDGAKIHGVMDELAEVLSVETELPQIERLGRAKRASESFVSKPSVRAMGYNKTLRDREAILAATNQALAMASELKVSFTQRSLTINEEGTKAILECMGNASGLINGTAQEHRARYRLEFIKHEGEWLIETVDVALD